MRLLPDREGERLRNDARETWSILGKLTLDLPCFGRWMPKSYWNLFQQATAHRQDSGISAEAILEAAARRRRELEGAGSECQIDAIVTDLKSGELAVPGREAEFRRRTARFISATSLPSGHRTVVARAIGFRTQRLAMAPDIDLDLRAVARSFFVDLVQSTFAATYRTGVWPVRFRSFVGRELAARIANRCLAAGEEPSAQLAFEFLDGTSRWGDERVGFETVTAEVKRSSLARRTDFRPR